MRNSSQVLQSTEATYESVRDGEEEGGGGGGGGGAQVPMCSPSKALRSAKNWKRPTASTRTVDVKVVGTSPVQSNVCTLQPALSAVVENIATKTAAREPVVETRSKGLSSYSL